MAFELPRIEKCCCCIPVRIGSLIIGYISIFFACLTLTAVSWSIYRVVVFVDDNEKHPSQEHPPDQVAKMALSLYVSFAYYLLVFLYYLVISLVLVVGVHMNKPKCLRFYCNATLFLFALAIALIVVTCVFMGFLATVPLLKWGVVLLSSFLVVRSAYLEMEEQNKPRAYEMQNLYIVQRAPLMT